MNELAHQQGAHGRLRELALFAGAGGGILGGHILGWRTVCAVECDPYAASVLVARQNDGVLPPFPIWDDVRTFDGHPWRGCVDVVSGGFPCQDISIAGRKAGIGGQRSGLWSEFARIIREVRPRFVFVENSPELVVRGLGTVLGDLAEAGYDAQWDCIPANIIGAHFLGERIWIVAEASPASSLRWERSRAATMGTDQWGGDEFARLVRVEAQHGIPAGSLGRISDGVPARMDRLKCIGNGQVPAVAAMAWRILTAGEVIE